MPKSVRFLATMLSVVIGLGVLASSAFAEAPEGWPAGFEWPPAKPNDWPTNQEWPPADQDLEWWIEHFSQWSETPESQGDPMEPTPDKNHAGYSKFAFAFPDIDWRLSPQQGQDRRDCGTFRLARPEYLPVETCDPYPAEVVQALCELALKPTIAEAMCRERCVQKFDGPPQKCTQAKLYTPAMFASFGCQARLELDLQLASCNAWFVCECEEAQ
jgi:hypothetical protein